MPAEGRTPRTVTWLAQAREDLKRLRQDDERLARRAIGLVQLVETGRLEGAPLQNLALYGDLSDCHKIYFGAEAGQNTHRITYRVIVDGHLELVEIVAVEQRQDGYVYLLAAKRLGRLPQETNRKLNRVHQSVIAARSALRRRKMKLPTSTDTAQFGRSASTPSIRRRGAAEPLETQHSRSAT